MLHLILYLQTPTSICQSSTYRQNGNVYKSMSLLTPGIDKCFSNPNAGGQPRHITVHICVYYAPPADSLCSDCVTAYVIDTMRAQHKVITSTLLLACLLVMWVVVSVQLEIPLPADLTLCFKPINAYPQYIVQFIIKLASNRAGISIVRPGGQLWPPNWF